MEEYDTRILVDAKTEYTKELTRILKKHFFEGIESLFREAIEACENDYCNVYITFQDYLSGIPKWNQDTIERETTRIIECSECEFLEDLLTAVFISHTKILAAIRVNKNNKRINLNIPKIDHFIHKCYIEIAREFWKAPTYFNKKINNYEIQRNNKIIEDIITTCINETIRKMLPLKHILKESLGDQYNESDSSDNEDIHKNISKSDEKNLQKLVKKEIESLYNSKNMTCLSDKEIKKDNEVSLEDKKLDFSSSKELETNLEFNNEETKKINNSKQIGGEVNEINIDLSQNSIKEDLNKEKVISLNKPLTTSLFNESIADSNNLITTLEDNKKEIFDNSIDNQNDNKDKIIDIDESSTSIPLTSIDNNVDDLNELDLSSLSNSSDVLKVDNNFNLVSNNDDIYNNLNSEINIKTEVANDLELNKPKNDNFVFFEDAPEVETI